MHEKSLQPSDLDNDLEVQPTIVTKSALPAGTLSITAYNGDTEAAGGNPFTIHTTVQRITPRLSRRQLIRVAWRPQTVSRP